MASDREILQELLDEQLTGAATAGRCAGLARDSETFLEVERQFMRRARVVALVMMYADDTKAAAVWEEPRQGPRLVYSRASIT